ncbi:class I SAM-dependent methyltransferase [Patescibacteria group bacterium]|nr:class I SAM-dependent methyltransferase [Patescibacteria group bacterium]
MIKNKVIKLDIGCGERKKKGFVGIDIDPNSDADIIASALDLPIENDSIDEIQSSHLIEHFLPKETQRFFDEIYRVLKRGKLANIKIDKDWTKKRLLAKDSTHKYRYKTKEIKKMLEKFSYKKVKDKIFFFRLYQPRRKIFIKLIK